MQVQTIRAATLPETAPRHAAERHTAPRRGPEPGLLTAEEIRQIVLEVLG
jgi:hypothetical protein